jgi:hypothetical protein
VTIGLWAVLTATAGVVSSVFRQGAGGG